MLERSSSAAGEAGGAVAGPRPAAIPPTRPEDCLAGGGAMGALMRETDWRLTSVGAVETWPQSLRTSVSTCLGSRFPILLWWGPELVMLYNDAYRAILGDKHPQSMGQRGRECWPEIWPIIGPMLAGVIESGEATWSDLMLTLERKGYPEECYFTFSYSPIRDESGGVGGVFTAVTETTGQVIGERRLRTLRDLAASAVGAREVRAACRTAIEVLGGNTADVSHEFRTPLTLMLGPLEELLGCRAAELPSFARDELEVTHRNALRLLKLINMLLDFSRIEAGRTRARFEPVDLAQVTAEMASAFRSAVESAGLRLRVECPPLPEPVYVDRQMWEKVVLNLVSNAFKFTFEGEIAVTLRWTGSGAELTVAGTGTGIADHELPRLFERFHRGPERSRGSKGWTPEPTTTS